jgi:hypothetical protein
MPWAREGSQERRQALRIRIAVSAIAVVAVSAILWVTKAESADPYRNSIIIGVVFIVTVLSFLPFLLYVYLLHTLRWSVVTGLALLLASALMYLSILMSESSTASMGFLASIIFNIAILMIGRLLERRSLRRLA